MDLTKKKKITLATVKSFINKNKGKGLVIKAKSSFDGMVDCVMPIKDAIWLTVEADKVNTKPGEDATMGEQRTFGIDGAWFVGDSRDYFTVVTTPEGWQGIEVWNCCGSFVLAVRPQ